MSAPLKEKDCLIAIFDSYAKTTARNACRDAVAQARNKREKDQAKLKKLQYLFEIHDHEDAYPSEHLVLHGRTHICVVTSVWLYDALQRLPEIQREVIILDFWYGCTDVEIASHLKVTPRTIYNWRKKAFTAIRDYYERIKR